MNLANVQHKPVIFILPGSLRENSSTYAVINAARAAISDAASFTTFDIGTLPHFNDSKEPPQEVEDFRAMLREADGVLVCTPEYAFGVPGSLKNALDWTVSSGELVYKPAAVIVAATGGDKAYASLLLTLSALSATVADDARLLISFIRAKLDEKGDVKDTTTLQAIEGVAAALLRTIQASE